MRYLEAKITKLLRRGGLNSTFSFTPGQSKQNKEQKKLCLYLDGVLTALLIQANEGGTTIGQELPEATKCPATTSRTTCPRCCARTKAHAEYCCMILLL